MGNPGHTRGVGKWWNRIEEPCGTNGGCYVALVQGRIDEIWLGDKLYKTGWWCMSLVPELGKWRQNDHVLKVFLTYLVFEATLAP